MARRVSTGKGIGEASNIFADLALLGQLDADQEGQIAPEDLIGTSQDPMDFNEVPVPQYTDVRQNRVQEPGEAYADSLRAISQLPMAMSQDQDIRKDALENMQNFQRSPSDAVQEEQLEGLSGAQGADQARQVGLNASMLPKTKSGSLQDPLEFLRIRVQEDPSLLNDLPEETRKMLSETTPDAEKAFVPEGQQPKAPEVGQNQPQQGQEEQAPTVPADQPIQPGMIEEYPDQEPKQGAIEQLTEDQLLQKDLLELAGNEIPEEQMNRAVQWQNVYSKEKNALTAEELALSQQAEQGNISTFDKIALGIAIAVPILIALRYGKTAGMLAAGGALKSFGENVQEQQKTNAARDLKKTERLGQVRKERLNLEEKDVDINKKIIDSIEDKAARKFLKNKKFRQFGDNLAISTGDEGGQLWLDAKKFDTSDEGIKRARKVVEEADETIGVMRDSNKVVNDVLEILGQLPDSTGAWDAVKKNAQWFTSAGGHNPFGGEAPKITMVGADGKTRQVDAFAVLKQKINLLQDLYNKQILGGTRLTGNVITHWSGILGDPTHIKDWMSQDLNTFKDTTRSLKDIMNSREVENLVGKGFVRQPLEKAFPSYEDQILESDENVLNQMRSNPQAYKGKVK